MDAKMLDGKVAIVSGASYGMGQTMAELFAREGAKVVMTARGQEKLDAAVAEIRAKGYDVTGVVADNKKLEDVQRVIQTALDVYDDLDIVINNAAIGEQKMIDETDDEWLEHVYQTNVFGPFRFIREALKIFMPKNEGCIINISSVNGERPFCGAAYTSSKGAINTLTKNVAMRLIDTNIRIKLTRPGSSPAARRCWSTAGTSSTSPARNVTPSTRRTPACFWPPTWADMSRDRSSRCATAHSCKELCPGGCYETMDCGIARVDDVAGVLSGNTCGRKRDRKLYALYGLYASTGGADGPDSGHGSRYAGGVVLPRWQHGI